MTTVKNEITVLKYMQHNGIIRIFDFGNNGKIVKPSGRVVEHIVYIVMEYVDGGLMFDLCKEMGPLGEDASRFFLM